MGKNGPSLAVRASSRSGKMTGPVTERLNMLEKRYSRVLVHSTYFKLLDEWMRRMFGEDLN
jgi:hypothetical protein